MPLPILPLLGGLARLAGSAAMRATGAVARGAGRGAGAAARGAGEAAKRLPGLAGRHPALSMLTAREVLARRRARDEKVDEKELGRRLGTPVPSKKQIEDEKLRLASEKLSKSFSVAATSSLAIRRLGLAAVGTEIGLKLVGHRAIQAAQSLVLYNGQIGAAVQRAKRQQLLLDVRRAARTSGSTTALFDSMMRAKEERSVYKELGTVFSNKLGQLGYSIETGFYGVLESMGIKKAAELIVEWLGKGEDTKELNPEIRHFLDRIRVGDFGGPMPRVVRPNDRNSPNRRRGL